jgi:uncharacterized membrane protein
MPLSFLVLLRIISNPLSNVFQKKLVQDKSSSLFIIFATHGLLTIAALPFLKIIIKPGLPVEYFFYMMLCAIFAVISNVLIVKALSVSDLSLLGPVNSYKPVVSLIVGFFIIHEIPGILGVIGVILIITGSYFIADNNYSNNRQADEIDDNSQVIQQNTRSRFSLLEEKYGTGIAARINSGKIWKGMNAEMVKDSWGSPQRINRIINGNTMNEQWTYKNTVLYFRDNLLVDWGPLRN